MRAIIPSQTHNTRFYVKKELRIYICKKKFPQMLLVIQQSILSKKKYTPMQIFAEKQMFKHDTKLLETRMNITRIHNRYIEKQCSVTC